jgi:hypothetical protein
MCSQTAMLSSSAAEDIIRYMQVQWHNVCVLMSNIPHFTASEDKGLTATDTVGDLAALSSATERDYGQQRLAVGEH